VVGDALVYDVRSFGGGQPKLQISLAASPVKCWANAEEMFAGNFSYRMIGSCPLAEDAGGAARQRIGPVRRSLAFEAERLPESNAITDCWLLKHEVAQPPIALGAW